MGNKTRQSCSYSLPQAFYFGHCCEVYSWAGLTFGLNQNGSFYVLKFSQSSEQFVEGLEQDNSHANIFRDRNVCLFHKTDEKNGSDMQIKTEKEKKPSLLLGEIQ